MAKQTLTPEEKAAEKAAEQSAHKATERESAEKADCEAADKETAEEITHEAAEKSDAAKTEQDPAARQAAGQAQKQAAPPAESAADDKLTRTALQILSEYPDAPEVFMTSNGFGFFKETDARNHAATLRDKTIIHVKRK